MQMALAPPSLSMEFQWNLCVGQFTSTWYICFNFGLVAQNVFCLFTETAFDLKLYLWSNKIINLLLIDIQHYVSVMKRKREKCLTFRRQIAPEYLWPLTIHGNMISTPRLPTECYPQQSCFSLRASRARCKNKSIWDIIPTIQIKRLSNTHI